MVATRQVAMIKKTNLQAILIEGIINDALKFHVNTKQALIPILQEIQKQLGYLPYQGLMIVSKKLKISLSSIYGISTFYHEFTLKPLGKYIIRLCMGTACHVKGNSDNYAFLKKSLGMYPGESTTEDGLFSVIKVRCLGCCSLAPVMKINDEIYGKLNFRKIRHIISNYKLIEKKKQKQIFVTIKLGGNKYKLKENDLEVLRKTSLRWWILKCLHAVICETRFDVPRSIENDLDVIRSIIETGCQKPKVASALMNWVENKLIDKAISLSNMKYWEDLLWKASNSRLNQTDIEKMPYMNEMKDKYNFLSYMIETENKVQEQFKTVD